MILSVLVALKVPSGAMKNSLSLSHTQKKSLPLHPATIISPLVPQEKRRLLFSRKYMNEPEWIEIITIETAKLSTILDSQKSIVAAISLKDAFLPKEYVLLAQTELHHSSSLLGTIHMNPMYGCTTYVLKEYTFERFLLAIQNCKINLIITQPWITASMAKEPIVDKYDISSLCFMLTGGSVVNKNMCMTFYKRFGVPAINGFGITEILNTFDASFEWTLAGKAAIYKLHSKADDNIFSHFIYHRRNWPIRTWIFMQIN